MNRDGCDKRLLAVLTLIMPTITMADVSLYGKVAVGVQVDSFQNSTIPQTNSVQDFGSYFGIRGYDQVYGVTSAIWQIEQFLDLAIGQAYSFAPGGGAIIPRGGVNGVQSGRVLGELNVLASGESYLGLQGLWGRIRLGNLSNYMRSSMGALDMYTYVNGADGLGLYSRTTKLLPTSIRYDSPNWGGFSFAAMYSFQSTGQSGVYGLHPGSAFTGSLNGFYSGGLYSVGVGWTSNNFSIKAGTMVIENVGTYTNNFQHRFNPVGDTYPNSAYSYGYANRVEIGYNDPDDMILGVGFQTTSGMGWGGWFTSGGSWGNYLANLGYNYPGLNTNQYQTQEIGSTFGWHLGPWTPKVSYMYGNNIMYNGNLINVASGSANQIPASGYQQIVGELDWNITPRTIVFVNYGQIWYGDTLANITFCGNNCGNVTLINSMNRANNSQATGGIGFSHTF